MSEFHSTWNDFNNGNEFACVIGNHDAEEDGNPKIFKQAQEFCKDHWYRKVAEGTTLLLGLDTNGDIQSEILWGQNILSEQTIMKGVKTVIFFSHKMAHSHPSHHPVESSTIELYEKIQSSIPKLEFMKLLDIITLWPKVRMVCFRSRRRISLSSLS